MAFQILEEDLLGRNGRIQTRSGSFETPALLPVVNPSIQAIAPKELQERFRCEAVITNAYILKKNSYHQALEGGVHGLLGFEQSVMTDSGAYQILVYDNIDATPYEIAKFQEEIATDIAVILDIPTRWDIKREEAESSVNETLERARSTLNWRERKDILWVGPIQGGRYLDLVQRSAVEMAHLPFDIYALGSPTPVMENYLFGTLANMVLTAKRSLPTDKPLHLFGAGHPMMFPLAVALGCDMFDSAAYALYARRMRYMTSWGTLELRRMEQLPCPCEVCSSREVDDLLSLSRDQRERLLARHNLFVCLAEVRRVREAIHEGRLWELLQERSRVHPALREATSVIAQSSDLMEAHTPISKGRGLLFADSSDLGRPEFSRYRSRLRERFLVRAPREVALLLPHSSKPHHLSSKVRRTLTLVARELSSSLDRIEILFYGSPFGVTPFGLDDVYPVSQTETGATDTSTLREIADSIAELLQSSSYTKLIMLVSERDRVSDLFARRLMENSTGKQLQIVRANRGSSKSVAALLIERLKSTMG